MYKLQCKSMNYSWGKPAETSLVALISKSNNTQIDSSLPYAEYWMGSHPNGPSSIILPNSTSPTPLTTYLSNNTLSYLFKVLSINMPLSIQMHPNKSDAENLHQQHPSIYKDANHKPELFIAISSTFELLIGFKPIHLAKSTLLEFKNAFHFKEAELFLQNDTMENYKEFIKAIVSLDKNEVDSIIEKILNIENASSNKELVDRLYKQFGKDIGILVALFMNHVYKKKGESMFITPNFPHAYLDGECFEAMANSDNVIRLGLTPKFVDKETFNMLLNLYFNDMIYDSEDEKVNDFVKKDEKDIVTYHKNGFDDFCLKEIHLNQNDSVELKVKSCSIIFVFEGTAKVEFNNNGSKVNNSIEQYESYFIENEIESLKINTTSQKSTIMIVSQF